MGTPRTLFKPMPKAFPALFPHSPSTTPYTPYCLLPSPSPFISCLSALAHAGLPCHKGIFKLTLHSLWCPAPMSPSPRSCAEIGPDSSPQTHDLSFSTPTWDFSVLPWSGVKFVHVCLSQSSPGMRVGEVLRLPHPFIPPRPSDATLNFVHFPPVPKPPSTGGGTYGLRTSSHSFIYWPRSSQTPLKSHVGSNHAPVLSLQCLCTALRVPSKLLLLVQEGPCPHPGFHTISHVPP